MPLTYLVATLNINGITAPVRRNMLSAFVTHRAIDIVLLQEVTSAIVACVPGYESHLNIGTENRGTAILVKEGLTSRDILRIPSGRGMAATINGIRYINVYAPSGTEKKKEREDFFNRLLRTLIPTTSGEMVLAGDFNIVINSLDATGATHYSKTLHKLIHTLELQDAWDVHTAPRGFTHYTANAASRIDRIYITKHLLEQKQCVRKVAAPFTDHMAVILHLKTDLPLTTWGRGYWKLNMATVRDPATFETLKTKWTLWQRQRSQYNDILTWWTRFIKKQIKRYYTSIGTARRRDRDQLENFYFSALYDVMKSDLPPGRMYDTINDLRRKINNLQTGDTGKFFSTSPEQALQTDEHPTLYHIIRLQKRKQSRHIGSIRDARNELHTTQPEISRTFLEDLTHRFETHNPDEAAKNHILEHITRRITDIDNIALLQPITKEELRTAVHNRPTNKSPGIDGISSDLYRHTWPLLHTDLLAVLNTMRSEE